MFLSSAIFVPEFFNKLFSTSYSANKLKSRGVVLGVEDLLTLNWPLLAHEAGLTTIGTHRTPDEVSKYILSDKGQKFLSDCKKYNINVEHELHAMQELLPRALFLKDPTMFRMNKEGIRTPDYNCCPSSKEALDIITENAIKYSEILRSTTGRYFYWMDDGEPMCRCGQCAELTDAEQALVVENAIIKGLRGKYSNASLAHLAYANEITPPKKITPEEGIFLEFAPIYRSWDKPLSDRNAGSTGKIRGVKTFITHGETLDLLKANLQVFSKDTAQVLEYWLDDSLQSKWKKPPVKLSWNPDVCKSDVKTYMDAGITNITTFAVYIDGTYKNMYHDLDFIKEYGEILNSFK